MSDFWLSALIAGVFSFIVGRMTAKPDPSDFEENLYASAIEGKRVIVAVDDKAYRFVVENGFMVIKQTKITEHETENPSENPA